MNDGIITFSNPEAMGARPCSFKKYSNQLNYYIEGYQWIQEIFRDQNNNMYCLNNDALITVLKEKQLINGLSTLFRTFF